MIKVNQVLKYLKGWLGSQKTEDNPHEGTMMLNHPLHFGWRKKVLGGGCMQEISINKITHKGIPIYNGTKEIARIVKTKKD